MLFLLVSWFLLGLATIEMNPSCYSQHLPNGIGGALGDLVPINLTSLGAKILSRDGIGRLENEPGGTTLVHSQIGNFRRRLPFLRGAVNNATAGRGFRTIPESG